MMTKRHHWMMTTGVVVRWRRDSRMTTSWPTGCSARWRWSSSAGVVRSSCRFHSIGFVFGRGFASREDRSSTNSTCPRSRSECERNDCARTNCAEWNSIHRRTRRVREGGRETHLPAGAALSVALVAEVGHVLDHPRVDLGERQAFILTVFDGFGDQFGVGEIAPGVLPRRLRIVQTQFIFDHQGQTRIELDRRSTMTSRCRFQLLVRRKFVVFRQIVAELVQERARRAARRVTGRVRRQAGRVERFVV